MAGLMAARVLADHFAEVVVLERDPRPESAEARAGAPQGDHLHGLLRRGQLVLEALFPGLIEDLVAHGAILSGDAGADLRAYMFGAWAVTCEVGFGMLQVTRPRLELGVRRRVEALPNITFRYGATAESLLTDGVRVTGVSLREEAASIRADLTIDASGRGATGLDSLKTHGFPAPREDIVGLDFGYASAMFEIPPGFQADWSALLIGAVPPDSQGALLQAVEGGRWLASFGARGAQRPEPTETGFRAFAENLPAPMIHDLLSRARMLGPVKTYRFTASVHRRFDLLERHPEGFLAVGDAICSLNPVYGQGMSVSAMEVEAFATCLAAQDGGSLEGLWRAFYPRTLEAVSVPWSQCLAVDMLYETTRFERPKGFENLRRGLLWAQKLSLRDPALRARFLRTANLVPGPGDGISPLSLLAAQARIWLNSRGAGVSPGYRMEDDRGGLARWVGD